MSGTCRLARRCGSAGVARAARTIAFVGDGNNVAASLAHAGRCSASTCTSRRRGASAAALAVVQQAHERARHGARLRALRPTRPKPCVGADAVYTDVGRRWDRKPKPSVAAKRLPALSGERDLMAAAEAGRALHALPAGAPRRGSHRRRSSSRPRPSCSIRPKTACTARRRCCSCCSAPVSRVNSQMTRDRPGCPTTTRASPRRSRRTRTARSLDYISELARERPAGPALLFKGATVTYAELERQSDAFANALASLGDRQG